MDPIAFFQILEFLKIAIMEIAPYASVLIGATMVLFGEKGLPNSSQVVKSLIVAIGCVLAGLGVGYLGSRWGS